MPAHLSIWQEAISVWLCANLNKTDYVFGNHRSHGHYLAKWGDINRLMAELFWKKTWCSRWIWWSMHINDIKAGMIGTSAIVWWAIPLAAGAALASLISGRKNISVCFFGDWAMNEWIFYETINFAVLKKLPIIFACENNLYATHMPINKHIANINIEKIVKGFNITTHKMDWNNVLEIYTKTGEIVSNIRRWKWPVFIEFKTYRINWHVTVWVDFDGLGRSKKEIALWKDKCPIKQLESKILDDKILSKNNLDKIDLQTKWIIDKAINYTQKSVNLSKEEIEDLILD